MVSARILVAWKGLKEYIIVYILVLQSRNRFLTPYLWV